MFKDKNLSLVVSKSSLTLQKKLLGIKEEKAKVVAVGWGMELNTALVI